MLAYDTEYAMVDRDDDLKIGIRTSAITLGRFDVAGVMAFYAVYLLSWLYLGLKLGLGPSYAVGIVVAGLQAALALHADLGPHPRRLLPRVPRQPLGGRGGVRGRGAVVRVHGHGALG